MSWDRPRAIASRTIGDSEHGYTRRRPVLDAFAWNRERRLALGVDQDNTIDAWMVRDHWEAEASAG